MLDIFLTFKMAIFLQKNISLSPHPEKLAGDHKKILIDGYLYFLKEAQFWNQEMKKKISYGRPKKLRAFKAHTLKSLIE